jgi:hypothetical protein
MTTAAPSICQACSRLGPNEDGTGLACAAFPTMIPEDITEGQYDHRNPYPGDNGVLFDLDPAEEPMLALFEQSVSAV